MKKYKVTIESNEYNPIKRVSEPRQFSGEFEAKNKRAARNQAKNDYAFELDTEPSEIKIIKVELIPEKKKYSDKEVIELWRNMEDVPTDENNEVIENDYFIWKEGTLLSEIWAWYNLNYSKGLKELWLEALYE